MRPCLVAILLALAVAACGSAAVTPSPDSSATAPAAVGVDPAVEELLLASGQVPSGPTTSIPTTIGDLADAPWALYLDVSKQAGLDFTAAAGRSATILKTPVAGRNADAAAYVLIVDGRVAGAWVGPGGSTSGVLPISQRP